MIEKYLESTNLNEKANWKDIRNLVKEANDNNILGVCTYLNWHMIVNKYASPELKKIYVIGFYTGHPIQTAKDLQYVKDTKGDEFDLVFPLSVLVGGNITFIREILQSARKKTEGKILKIIIETNILRELPEPELKFKEVIKICEEEKADYIKTNTGRFPRTVPIEDDVKLIQKFTKLPIKCAGGIKTYEQTKKLLNMKVKRFGTSNAIQIINEEKLSEKERS